MIKSLQMQKVIGFAFILLIVLSGSFSCKKDKDEAPDMGYNYFPNQVGKYVIYDVDSFYYDDFFSPVKIDTTRFQLKEKIQSTYLDNQNRTTLRLERYVRYYNPLVPYSSLPWVLRDVWAANRTATTAEKVEENDRYIKLAFPVKLEKEWNGNAQNVYGEQTYFFEFVNVARTIGGTTFDSVLQVNQKDESSLIGVQYYIEKYAKRTGMVYKQVIDIQSQPNPNWYNTALFPFGMDSVSLFLGKPIMTRVTSGFQYTYTYNSSGTE